VSAALRLNATSTGDAPQVAGESSERTAAEVVFENATKVYPGQEGPALCEFSLRIPAGEICMLVGPSGAGKTTALKLINRLLEPTSGDVLLDGRSVRTFDPPELRRHIGYVIQQVGLFPHQTVAGNIATVPRLLGWDRRRIEARVRELLELVGLDPDADGRRYPSQLSGGQQQRVGLARAMAADPLVMLLDEPFGALDPITRLRLQDEFLRLHREVHKTVVFVTHDIDEAIHMGDRVAILRDNGYLAQYDVPDRLLAHPADDFVARFVGADRALKRLSLRRLSDIDLPPAAGAEGYERIPCDTTLRDAMSRMLSDPDRPLLVVDAGGRPAGVVTVDVIFRSLEEEAS
jgi:osmoprotectant transport system ATP-binding protein